MCVFNKWITEPPKHTETLVVVQPYDSSPTLGCADYSYYKDGKPVDLLGTYGGSCGSKPVLAYMKIPTVDIDRKYWHSEFWGDKEPKNGKKYLVTIEHRPNHFMLGQAWYVKDQWRGVDNVVAWREFPTTYWPKWLKRKPGT